MNLAQVADELYRLTPAEFIAARDEHARRARAAGDAGLARSIMTLRRPSVSAWVVNQLAPVAGDRLGQLLELGESLREAQRALAGDRLRELSGQRRQLVAAVVQEAKRLAASAGQTLSAQAEREVATTLEAALADPDAAQAVRSGQLTRALSHVGLGGEDADEVVAVPPARREPARREPAPREPARRERPARSAGPARAAAAEQRQERAAAAERGSAEAAEQRRAREAEAAEHDLREAHEIAREARAALAEAEQRLAAVRDQRQAARQRADELERLLSEAEAEQTSLTRAARDAQRSRDVAAKWLDTAERRLTRAQDRAAKHTT